jgi:hypothetical protein
MNGTKQYDGELQMFCEPAHEVDLAKLRFLRWLIDEGKLEHAASGPPDGEYAELERLISGGAVAAESDSSPINAAYPHER